MPILKYVVTFFFLPVIVNECSPNQVLHKISLHKKKGIYDEIKWNYSMCTEKKKNIFSDTKKSFKSRTETGKALEFGHSYRACATSVNVVYDAVRYEHFIHKTRAQQ